MKYITVSFLIFGLLGCIRYPSTITPVDGFELNRYLGRWYEVARLDHSFERGLTKVTADYTLNEDGTIRVVNRGFRPHLGEWKEAVGTAKLAGSVDQGFLKVSFFGPFYGAYVIFRLADDYGYAYVSGPNTGYLWLLARTPEVNDKVIEDFIETATNAGFEVDELIFVKH